MLRPTIEGDIGEYSHQGGREARGGDVSATAAASS